MLSTNEELYLKKLVVNSENNPKAIGYEKLVIDGTARSLTVPAKARYALIVVESSVTSGFVIRYLEWGGTPTTTDGLPRSHGDAFDILDYANLVGFKAVQTQAGTHTLHIQYYR